MHHVLFLIVLSILTSVSVTQAQTISDCDINRPYISEVRGNGLRLTLHQPNREDVVLYESVNSALFYPPWSADGTFVAAPTTSGLAFYEIATGRRLPVPNLRDAFIYHQWSPRGDDVLLADELRGSFADMMLFDMNVPDSTVIGRFYSSTTLRQGWLATGRYIYYSMTLDHNPFDDEFTRDSKRFYIFDTLLEIEREIARYDAPNLSLRWYFESSADDRYAVLLTEFQDSTLAQLLEIRTGELTTLDVDITRRIGWFDDNAGFVFDEDNILNYYDMEEQAVTWSIEAKNRFLILSNNTNVVWIISFNGTLDNSERGFSELLLVDRTGTIIKSITPNNGFEGFVVSRNYQNVAYSETPHGIQGTIQIETTLRDGVTSFEGAIIPHWTPDNRYLPYSIDDDVYLYDIDEDSHCYLIEAEGILNIWWSP